ncbi:hypothetical protein QA802_34105 [Streptomyces sp. B21-105]
MLSLIASSSRTRGTVNATTDIIAMSGGCAPCLCVALSPPRILANAAMS